MLGRRGAQTFPTLDLSKFIASVDEEAQDGLGILGTAAGGVGRQWTEPRHGQAAVLPPLGTCLCMDPQSTLLGNSGLWGE